MLNPPDAAVRPHLKSWLIDALVLRLRLNGSPAAREALSGIEGWRDPQNMRWSPGEGCAVALGAEAALRVLSALATESASKTERKSAVALLELYAEARGLTRDQLEDRLVDECRLGGRLVVDRNKRRFVLELGHRHTPLLRLIGGRAYTNWPRWRSGDSGWSSDSIRDWLALRPRLRAESRVQTARLEQAMVVGRRWSALEFEQQILGNALLAELARRQIWAGYGPDGALLECFSLADQLSPINEAYAPVRLDRFAVIGLPHPASVARARRVVWAELLADFQIVEQFPQTGRPVYELTEAEHQGEAITRFAGQTLRQGAVYIELPRRDWRFMRIGRGYYSLKPFSAAGATALITWHYVPQGAQAARLHFARGLLVSSAEPSDIVALPLAQIDPVVISEAISDIAWLVSWASVAS